jgi:hypothetical protein
MHTSFNGQHEAYGDAVHETTAAHDALSALRTHARAAGSGWSA